MREIGFRYVLRNAGGRQIEGVIVLGSVRRVAWSTACALLALAAIGPVADDQAQARQSEANVRKGAAASAKAGAARTCAAVDIEGAWFRADGAALRILGVGDGQGATGLYFVNPRGWRRGVPRYTALRQVEGCAFEAVCVDVQRKTDDETDYTVAKRPCELTLDPARGVLSQDGKAAFSREPSMTAEAEARRTSEAELDAQERRTSELNAEISRRNAEAEGRETAREAEYARQMREYEARKSADAEAYARAQADYARKTAEVEAQRQRDLAEWEARVAACKAGDETACAPR